MSLKGTICEESFSLFPLCKDENFNYADLKGSVKAGSGSSKVVMKGLNELWSYYFHILQFRKGSQGVSLGVAGGGGGGGVAIRPS